MRRNLNLRQLEAFVHVAASKNFRQAAAELEQSQPVISRLIRQAEQALGARLFDRDTRRVDITPIGRQLLPIAKRVLRNFDDDLEEFRDFMAGGSGRIAVVALPSLSVSVLPQAIAAFADSYPRVTYDLFEAPAERLLSMLLEEGKVDFGLSVRPDPDRRLQFHPLTDDPFVLLCRRDHPLASRKTVPWSVFGNQPCIVSAQHTSIRPVTDAVFQRLATPPQILLEFPSVPAAGALVASGIGIAALPQMTLGLLDMQALTAVPLTRPYMSRPVGLVTRVGRSLSPVTRAFMDQLMNRDFTGLRNQSG